MLAVAKAGGERVSRFGKNRVRLSCIASFAWDRLLVLNIFDAPTSLFP
jgi:hypothetical protein